MPKSSPTKKPRSINRQLTSLEKLVRAGFRQTDGRFRKIDGGFEQMDGRLRQVDKRFEQMDGRFRQVDKRFEQMDGRFRQVDRRFNLVDLEFRNLRKEMNERFALMEERFDRLITHIDGLVKLHETLYIELKVMKEQMNRFEERLQRVEAAQTS